VCTSIVSNGKKTIVGWNLDILDMEHKVVAEGERVFIAIDDDRGLAAPVRRERAR